MNGLGPTMIYVRVVQDCKKFYKKMKNWTLRSKIIETLRYKLF